MQQIFSKCAAGNEDVIYVDKTKVKLGKQLVLEWLECLCRFAQSQWHPHILEEAKFCGIGRLGDVCLSHTTW